MELPFVQILIAVAIILVQYILCLSGHKMHVALKIEADKVFLPTANE